jgi:prophage maintenance system killer protein
LVLRRGQYRGSRRKTIAWRRAEPSFEQGNKRTALISTALFLQDNGYRFVVDDAEFLGELVRAAIVGDRSERDFIAILRTFIAAV